MQVDTTAHTGNRPRFRVQLRKRRTHVSASRCRRFRHSICLREDLQRRAELKRWSWNYKGRQIYLSKQADKAVRLLDRFKAVENIVANVDPVHVGLPWAGVRAILEVRMI